MIIFDSEILTPQECRNKAFRQKIHMEAIRAMYGLPEDAIFDMYDFQDDPTLVGAMNKGTGGVLGNMAWDNAALRTGAGWYVPPQIAGAYGFGMVNDGGVSGHYGSVVGHNGNDVAGKDKFTLTFTINLATVGEGGVGTLLFKDGAYAVQFDVVDEIRFIMWDGAAWRAYETTDSPLASWNHWHQVTITYNAGTVVIYVDGIARAGAGALIPVVLHDAGNILYIMDNAANTSAVDGILGQLGLYPGLAMSAAQEQGLVELRGLFQPTVPNQPAIPSGPGTWGPPDYDFDGNNDYLVSNLTNQLDDSRTILMWATVTNAVARSYLVTTRDGADGFVIRIDAGGNLRYFNTGLPFDMTVAYNAYLGVPTFLAFTYDSSGGGSGSIYINGEIVASDTGGMNPSVVPMRMGSNEGLSAYLLGQISKLVCMDDVLSGLEIARIAQSSGLGWQRQFGT